MTTFGETIKQIRQDRRDSPSLRAVAADARISHQYLDDIEHGRRLPSDGVLLRIAEALGVSARRLFKLRKQEGEKG